MKLLTPKLENVSWNRDELESLGKAISETNDLAFGHPTVYALKNIYPNPFNPITTIEFSVPDNNNEKVRLRVFDIAGRMVRDLTNRPYTSGIYKIEWDASHLSSGIYFLEFRVGSLRDIRKINLLK